MSRQFTRGQLSARAQIREAPALHQTAVDRTFDRTFGLPPRLYGLTVALYLGFIGILGLGFATPKLAIPLVIFAISIVAGFGVPMLWARMRPDHDSRPLAWSLFASRGIATLTGQVRANDAIAQVLVLPVLIFLWGVAVLIIAALT